MRCRGSSCRARTLARSVRQHRPRSRRRRRSPILLSPQAPRSPPPWRRRPRPRRRTRFWAARRFQPGRDEARSSITPRARGSEAPGTKVDEARMEIVRPRLFGPGRDEDREVLVVGGGLPPFDLQAVRDQRQLGILSRLRARPTYAQLQGPTDAAVELGEPEGDLLAGPRERASPRPGRARWDRRRSAGKGEPCRSPLPDRRLSP